MIICLLSSGFRLGGQNDGVKKCVIPELFYIILEQFFSLSSSHLFLRHPRAIFLFVILGLDPGIQ